MYINAEGSFRRLEYSNLHKAIRTADERGNFDFQDNKHKGQIDFVVYEEVNVNISLNQLKEYIMTFHTFNKLGRQGLLIS